MNLKTMLSIIAIFLTLIAYFPYIKNILRGKTKPHIYSWFAWSVNSGVIFALQFAGKAGAGAFVTLAAGLMCVTVFILCFFQNGKKDIAKIDIVFLSFSLISLALWIFAKQPVLSTILIMFADVSAFLPTIRKSWRKPYSETMASYAINTLRFSLTVLAIEKYSVQTTLSPGFWILGNGLFVLMLFLRRNSLASKSL